MGRFCFLEQCSTISSLDMAGGAKPHWSVNEKDGVDAMEVKDLRIA
jgi:hypothetical protein